MSLYISSTSASSETGDSPMGKAIVELAASIIMEKQAGSVPLGPSLDVTFMLPGKLDKPSFSGMRMGGYSQDTDTLYFERAVPDHLVESDQAWKYVSLVMYDVVEHAGAFFNEHDIDFDTQRWKQFVDQVSTVSIGKFAKH